MSAQAARPSYTTRVVPIRPDYERTLTAMTELDFLNHISAVSGDGLISESLVQRREREKRARQKLALWVFLIIPGCVAGWLIVFWSVLHVIEHIRS